MPQVKGLDSPDRYRNIAQALAERGYQEEEIRKIVGANWLRLFQQVWKE